MDDQTEPGAPAARAREKPQLVADELRDVILGGDHYDGELLAREADLIKRFGVSRPTLREALRILETEGLITVARGVHGGIVVRHPDEALTARAASMLLRSRNVALADVHAARELIEPAAAGAVARSPRHVAAADELEHLVDAQEAALDEPEAFAAANAAFHDRLVELAGNTTLAVVTEMLGVIIAGAVRDASGLPGQGPVRTRRRGLASQRRLLDILRGGDGPAAEEHWRSHLAVVGTVLLGDHGSSVVEALRA